MSGTKRSIIGSWGKRTAVMGASCREARAGVRRVRAFSSSLARDTNDLTCARSPKSRHGSLAAVHSASRAQPAHAHLGGAKKKAVGRALLTRSGEGVHGYVYASAWPLPRRSVCEGRTPAAAGHRLGGEAGRAAGDRRPRRRREAAPVLRRQPDRVRAGERARRRRADGPGRGTLPALSQDPAARVPAHHRRAPAGPHARRPTPRGGPEPARGASLGGPRRAATEPTPSRRRRPVGGPGPRRGQAAAQVMTQIWMARTGPLARLA